MFTARDGKKFGNNQTGKLYDNTRGGKPSVGAPAPAEPTEHAEPGQDVSSRPIHEVVTEHGPARNIKIVHDHEAGQHTVESHHGQEPEATVVHKSEHATPAEAHEHAAHAAGVGSEENATPDAQEAAMPGGNEQSSIPGM
jgi:hypothetical protein